jgi:hypothetical protein
MIVDTHALSIISHRIDSCCLKTYNIPTQKMLNNAILCLSGTCKRHRSGIGRARTTRSNARFTKPDAMKYLGCIMHFPATTLPYTDFETGLHWNISTNMQATAKSAEMAISEYAARCKDRIWARDV